MNGGQVSETTGRLQWAPVASLFILSPLIAEYLLGSMPMRLIGLLPIMAAMYGSAAILIREFVRRTGQGWRATALLGLAFGIVEEGLLDQSLFNRDYLHLHLLEYGYLPAFGTALPWLIFVLAIHVVWSIAIPIGLAEALFPGRREQAWLTPFATIIASALYLAGSTAVAVSTYATARFIASPAQLAGAVAAATVAIEAALVPQRARSPIEGRAAPAAWVIFVGTFLAGATWMSGRRVAVAEGWPWQICVVVLLAVGIMFIAFTIAATRQGRVTGRVRFAFVSAGLAVYACFGIETDHTLHGAADLPAHGGLVFVLIIIAAAAYRRSMAGSS